MESRNLHMNEVLLRQENEFSFLSPNLIHQKYFHSGTFSLQVNILSGQTFLYTSRDKRLVMFLYICHVTNFPGFAQTFVFVCPLLQEGKSYLKVCAF